MSAPIEMDEGTRKMIFAEAEAKRSPMHLIAQGFDGVDLWVGNRQAASDPELLREHGIGTVLNCAVNLDINLVAKPAADTTNLAFGWSDVRYYKLGLIDGPGNPAEMLIAGYYQLKGLIKQKMPDKKSYPWKESGHVLVNCRGGRSRSVILVCLFLHLERPEAFPTLEAAVDHVRKHRELVPQEWPSAPKQVLIDAAKWAAEAIRTVNRMEPFTPDA